MTCGVRVFEERHMISALLYLFKNDGCTKTELYRGVSTNPRMPDKLDRLEASGLVTMESTDSSKAIRIRLTDLGREVGRLLSEAEALMGP